MKFENNHEVVPNNTEVQQENANLNPLESVGEECMAAMKEAQDQYVDDVARVIDEIPGVPASVYSALESVAKSSSAGLKTKITAILAGLVAAYSPVKASSLDVVSAAEVEVVETEADKEGEGDSSEEKVDSSTADLLDGKFFEAIEDIQNSIEKKASVEVALDLGKYEGVYARSLGNQDGVHLVSINARSGQHENDIKAKIREENPGVDIRFVR